MSQSRSLPNLDTAMAIETDCTFKRVSSAVILNHRAFCHSEWPQKSLSSNWTVCHLWRVRSSSAGADVATESTEIVAWPRLRHAEMEATLQALKLSQVAQEQELSTRKLRWRSTELGSGPGASMQVKNMRSMVKGHSAPGWPLLTLDPAHLVGHLWFYSHNPLKLSWESSQNRSRTLSLSRIEIRAPRTGLSFQTVKRHIVLVWDLQILFCWITSLFCFKLPKRHHYLTLSSFCLLPLSAF